MRAYYSADRAKFFTNEPDAVLGSLAAHHRHDLTQEQTYAWLQQIAIMRQALSDISAFNVYFEFAIPRMGKRADVVVVIGDDIFVIEFKVGSEHFDRHAVEQVEDYALDLKNFHAGSHNLAIVPILVPTRVRASEVIQPELALDQVSRPLRVCPADLGDVLRLHAARPQRAFDANAWAASGYRPTPTIVEAARALYARHGVEDITRHDALNLGRTQDVIATVIDDAKNHGHKSVCFVTGVPGAGKTLAGLNIATRRSESHADEHATFLSGNGPLVDVLREALARDRNARTGQSKAHALREVRAFVQNIHHFRDGYAGNTDLPSEHVVIFDEAQRAWTRDQASKFMQSKRGVEGFNMSEPEFLLGVMDRHPDWCAVVCLIGGGQEINTGEAGLSEWTAAIRDRFPHWKVFASSAITQPDYDLTRDARAFISGDQVTLSDDLHLGVSMRSFRAESLSDFVSHLLNGDAEAARAAHQRLGQYPIVITRDLSAARAWLREKARGSERYGLVASSGGHRLRPEGVNIRADIDPPNWFLNDRDDVRSSFYLEEVATEFDVQGLELDWTGVCWDADLRCDQGRWSHHKFKGTRWQSVRETFQKLYLKNAYRVLLTRARQGMVIFVPKGDEADATRPPAFYDGIHDFLRTCGLPVL